jgi:hypothetical protein
MTAGCMPLSTSTQLRSMRRPSAVMSQDRPSEDAPSVRLAPMATVSPPGPTKMPSSFWRAVHSGDHNTRPTPASQPNNGGAGQGTEPAPRRPAHQALAGHRRLHRLLRHLPSPLAQIRAHPRRAVIAVGLLERTLHVRVEGSAPRLARRRGSTPPLVEPRLAELQGPTGQRMGPHRARSSGRRRTTPRSPRRLLDPQDHGSLEHTTLHPQLGVLPFSSRRL